MKTIKRRTKKQEQVENNFIEKADKIINSNEEKKQTTLYLPLSLYKKLKIYSIEQGKPANQIIIDALNSIIR